MHIVSESGGAQESAVSCTRSKKAQEHCPLPPTDHMRGPVRFHLPCLEGKDTTQQQRLSPMEEGLRGKGQVWMCSAESRESYRKVGPHEQKQRSLCYLTFLSGLWGERSAHTIFNGHSMDEYIVLWNWEERLFLLAKVQLHRAILAQHMRQQSSVTQRLLADPEGHTQVLPILGERQLHLFTFKVLQHKAQKYVSNEPSDSCHRGMLYKSRPFCRYSQQHGQEWGYSCKECQGKPP